MKNLRAHVRTLKRMEKELDAIRRKLRMEKDHPFIIAEGRADVTHDALVMVRVVLEVEYDRRQRAKDDAIPESSYEPKRQPLKAIKGGKS